MQRRVTILLVASMALAGCGDETLIVRDGTGGEIDEGSGGKLGSGGRTGSGGKLGSGGKIGSGGRTDGGVDGGGGVAVGSGGNADGSGGVADGSGGNADGSGGVDGSGGKLGSGGKIGSGGSGSGGKIGSGGSGSGGKIGSGGSGSGGKVGSGGTTIPNNCTEGNRSLTSDGTGQHCGYTYEYWKDSGTGTLTLKPDGFSVSWSNINNLLGRKGIRPGNSNLVATYEANYQPNGNSYLCIYGWTRNPLIEYYIVDSWGSWRPPGGQSIGTVESDGGTYDIYKTQRVDQPSIDGRKTFWQFWSVRKEKRTAGSITVGNHFAAWAKQGLTMGTFYEVSMTVEGYQSQGTADVKMVIK